MLCRTLRVRAHAEARVGYLVLEGFEDSLWLQLRSKPFCDEELFHVERTYASAATVSCQMRVQGFILGVGESSWVIDKDAC